MQTSLRPINMAEVLAPVPAVQELPLAQRVQELELRPALAVRALRLAPPAQVLELRPVEAELSPEAAEPSPEAVELRPVEAELSRVEAVVVIKSVTEVCRRLPRAAVPLAADPAEARLKPAVAGDTVARVDQRAEAGQKAVEEQKLAEATAEVRKVAEVVVAVEKEAVEDAEDKQNDQWKNQ